MIYVMERNTCCGKCYALTVLKTDSSRRKENLPKIREKMKTYAHCLVGRMPTLTFLDMLRK